MRTMRPGKDAAATNPATQTPTQTPTQVRETPPSDDPMGGSHGLFEEGER